MIQHSATLATVLVSVNDDTTKHTHDARLERAGVALAVENSPLFLFFLFVRVIGDGSGSPAFPAYEISSTHTILHSSKRIIQ